MITIPEGYVVQDSFVRFLLDSINTFDSQGRLNGFVTNIINPHLGGKLDQAYLTICNPGCIKGPHMHFAPKEDRFMCIRGKVVVVCKNEQSGIYAEYVLSADLLKPDEFPCLLVIPPFNSHALIAQDNKEAVVLSLPSEGYDPTVPYNQIETQYEGYDWSKWL